LAIAIEKFGAGDEAACSLMGSCNFGLGLWRMVLVKNKQIKNKNTHTYTTDTTNNNKTQLTIAIAISNITEDSEAKIDKIKIDNMIMAA
jgi:hypothetical protein